MCAKAILFDFGRINLKKGSEILMLCTIVKYSKARIILGEIGKIEFNQESAKDDV